MDSTFNDGNSSSIKHLGDAAVMAITTWNVMVITLEVNDFRHRLMVAYDTLPSSGETSNRYIASIIAIRYGLRDALIDWAMIYLIGYSIVAGITWTNAEPESVVVIQGFSVIASAGITAVAALKIPEWVSVTCAISEQVLFSLIYLHCRLRANIQFFNHTRQLGHYRKSGFSTLKDVSDLAPQAVQDLTTEGSTLKSFRYQVRLGVGKHFSQFVYFFLPFYVDLKIWWYLGSIVIGLIFGHLYLFVVFKCRQRFNAHRGRVSVGASIFLSLCSAGIFTRGMQIVQDGWVSKMLLIIFQLDSPLIFFHLICFVACSL